MFDDEDARAKKAAELVVGADLSAISVDELKERITLLEEEIARIQAEIAAKQSSKDAAESVFRS
ncbi:MAG: DUF1192 domain-containing protein [Hyphomicrobiales bacterium]